MVNCSDIKCYRSVKIPHQVLRIRLSALCLHQIGKGGQEKHKPLKQNLRSGQLALNELI